MHAMGGDQVAEAVACSAALLRRGADGDWEARAGRVEWSCRRVVEHLASDLVAYAGQLTGRATSAYVPFDIVLTEAAVHGGDMAQVIEATGGLLAATVRTVPPGVRGWHSLPYEHADATGFAAMGVAEVLLHTHDIARGLGLDFEPPAALCAALLARIFPETRPGPEPWPLLLWATGRGVLPGRPPVTSWAWHNARQIPADRIALHEVPPADAADLRMGGSGGLDWLDGAPLDGTRRAAEMTMKAYENGTLRADWGIYAIVRTADQRALGAIGFHGAPDEGRVEIGYDLTESARGQGYATEALRALSAWALSRPEAAVLHAVVEPGNAPSHAVAARAGYTPAATTEEGTLYALGRAGG